MSLTWVLSGQGARKIISSFTRIRQAIKTVDSSLQVGGPATAMNAWTEELLDCWGRIHGWLVVIGLATQ
jgi:hypothetical protein